MVLVAIRAVINALRSDITEFLIVIDYSTEAWLALMMALLVPASALAIGAWWLSSLDVSGPYGPIVAAATHPLGYVLMTLTGLLQIRLGAYALSRYRKAKRQLEG